jgi:hypothetical protein
VDPGQTYQLDTSVLQILDRLNVGDTDDEAAHDYSVSSPQPPIKLAGMIAEGRSLSDEGRTFLGRETFVMKSIPGQELVLIQRFDGTAGGTLMVNSNHRQVGEWHLRPSNGAFSEDLFEVPAQYIVGEKTTIELDFVPGTSPSANSYYLWSAVRR